MPDIETLPAEVQPAESPEPADASERLVPVTEAIRYRKRAQAAEQQLGALKAQFDQQASQISEANDTISRLERRQRIDALLNDADAVDLGVARLLTEQAVADMDDADVEEVIDDLRRHKPYLFRQRSLTSPAMAPRLTESGHDPVDHAAERAVNTGSRRDLLDYLRLRRRTSDQ